MSRYLNPAQGPARRKTQATGRSGPRSKPGRAFLADGSIEPAADEAVAVAAVAKVWRWRALPQAKSAS